jgi:tetratricopeptide (TPR) repeat protein
MATILGIDFGSSLCRTAVFRDGKAESFPNRFSERKLPFVVEVADGAVSFESIKQSVGFSDTVPTASDLFRAMRQDAKEATGEDIEAAVVTVPACFTERQRAALRQAAGEGGFGAVRLLDESMAALLATAIKPDKKTILVYALGAGVFSVSVLQMDSGAPRALWHEGNRNLGGNNFDAAIVALLLDRLGFTPEQFLDRQESGGKLKQLAENVKIGLSKRSSEEFDVNIGELFSEAAARKGHFSVAVSLTRSDLENALSGMIEETIDLASHAVEGAGLDPGKIDAILLLGDSTRIPLVEKRLGEVFPVEFVRAQGGAIAHGAAMHGSQLDEKAWEREKTHGRAPEEPSEEASSPEGWAALFSPGFDKAHKLWKEGEQDQAIAAVEGLIVQMPGFLARLYVIRGENHLVHGELDKALENFDKALKFNKNDRATQKLFHRACNLKARELMESRKFTEAKMAIRRGALYEPNCQGCFQLLRRIEKELDWTPSRKRRR